MPDFPAQKRLAWVQEGKSTMEAVVTRVLLGNPDEALDMLRTAERQGAQGFPPPPPPPSPFPLSFIKKLSPPSLRMSPKFSIEFISKLAQSSHNMMQGREAFSSTPDMNDEYSERCATYSKLISFCEHGIPSCPSPGMSPIRRIP